MTPQQLKKSILDLAFKGKLSKQLSNETSLNLLNKILNEGFNNKKYKKIDEVSFSQEIPLSWNWCMFHNVVALSNGEKTQGQSLPYLEARYLRTNSNPIFINSGEIVEAGARAILVDGENSGEIFNIMEKGYLGSTFKILNIVDFINEDYVLYFLKFHQDDYRNNKKGAAIPHLNKDVFFNMTFPIPPLEEQNRIVKKIEELLPLLDRYEEAWNKLETLNNKFPLDLEKSLLQLAVQGKLVEQIKEEGTGEELFKQIQAEKQELIKQGKVKKEKPLSKISNDEIPFEIPENWKWVRIIDIFNHSAGKALNSSDRNGKEYEYITTSNVYWNSFDLKNLKKMFYKESELEKCSATKGDLLVLEGGDVGRASIWNYEFDIRIQNHIHRLRPLKNIDVNFYYFIFFLFKNSGLINGKGIGIQGLSANRLKGLIVPLPPYAEQKRIVAKIEELLPFVRSLK